MPARPISRPGSRRPKYQIADDLRRRIEEGEFDRAPLPVIRELAREYDVSLNTISSAYKELEDQGVLERSGNSTPVIRPREQWSTPEPQRLEAVERRVAVLEAKFADLDAQVPPPLSGGDGSRDSTARNDRVEQLARQVQKLQAQVAGLVQPGALPADASKSSDTDEDSRRALASDN